MVRRIYNWDFSVTKGIKFEERLSAQFRAEFFNILNHPNISNPFGGPGGDNTYTEVRRQVLARAASASARRRRRHQFQSRAWLGWSSRHAIGFEADFLNFTPEVETAAKRARTKVRSFFRATFHTCFALIRMHLGKVIAAFHQPIFVNINKT